MFVVTWLGCAQDSLAEQQKGLVVFADGGELVSFEPPAPGDLRILVPEKGLHLCERVGHDVFYLRVGKDRLHPSLVVIDPTERPRRPDIARGLHHEPAEIMEESLSAGTHRLRRAEGPVKFILILHSCARKDARRAPRPAESPLCRVLPFPRLARAPLTRSCVCERIAFRRVEIRPVRFYIAD